MGLHKGQTNSGSFKKGEHKNKDTEIKKGQRLSAQTEFKKGQTPHNKGKRGVQKENSGSFKKGIIPWNKGNHKEGRELILKIRESFHTEKWRINCFKRDNWTCQDCKKNSQEIYDSHKKSLRDRINFLRRNGLVVHHIKHFKTILRENNIKTLEEAINCRELWNLDNGITLCGECHRKRHKKEGYRR